MEVEFTLKNVVDFMEAHGFHVNEAREEKRSEAGCPGPLPQDSEAGAIRLKITPAEKKATQKQGV